MKLIYYPNPILFQQCDPVNESVWSSPNIQRTELATAMWKIMDDHGGVGLAAPQVGLNIRMFVWKPVGDNIQNRAIWNPILNITTKNKLFGKEGCLSFPGVSVTMRRPIRSTLTGTNLIGKPITIRGGSTATRTWQHEIDHLDGKLIIDYMDRCDTIANRDALIELLNNHRG